MVETASAAPVMCVDGSDALGNMPKAILRKLGKNVIKLVVWLIAGSVFRSFLSNAHQFGLVVGKFGRADSGGLDGKPISFGFMFKRCMRWSFENKGGGGGGSLNHDVGKCGPRTRGNVHKEENVLKNESATQIVAN